jgi:tRNA pseudouridine38-40 synthase
MARYFLTLSYDGAFFNGWQVQQNTPNTVQQVLEEKLRMLLKEKIKVTGCGRTDTGVNARNYVAHFDSSEGSLMANKEHWIYKVNTVLPPAVAIQDIRTVTNEAHARYDASRRVYHYNLIRRRDPFRNRYAWYLHGELDFDLMNEAAALLKELSDFTSFSKLHSQSKTAICAIDTARWLPAGPDEWKFIIGADRFLRGMVRAVVGTLVLVGRKKLTVKDFSQIIHAKDRKSAGSNAPAQGLFFAGVKYPESVFI